jgi:putative glutamine amidotransferase
MPGALNHRRTDRAFELVHEAELMPGSLISRISGKRRLGVNSTHHQAIVQPAEPFIATARSRDGIVEVMELKPDLAASMPFLLAVQFHPERLVQKGGCYSAIFRSFVAACQNRGVEKIRKQSRSVSESGGLVQTNRRRL